MPKFTSVTGSVTNDIIHEAADGSTAAMPDDTVINLSDAHRTVLLIAETAGERVMSMPFGVRAAVVLLGVILVAFACALLWRNGRAVRRAKRGMLARGQVYHEN